MIDILFRTRCVLATYTQQSHTSLTLHHMLFALPYNINETRSLSVLLSANDFSFNVFFLLRKHFGSILLDYFPSQIIKCTFATVFILTFGLTIRGRRKTEFCHSNNILIKRHIISGEIENNPRTKPTERKKNVASGGRIGVEMTKSSNSIVYKMRLKVSAYLFVLFFLVVFGRVKSVSIMRR